MEDFALPRLFIFLGICILLITTVGGAAPPGWSALQDTLTHGFPTFNNPFDERLEADLRIVADGSIPPASVTDTDAVPFCTSTVGQSFTTWNGLSDGATTWTFTRFTSQEDVSASGGVTSRGWTISNESRAANFDVSLKFDRTAGHGTWIGLRMFNSRTGDFQDSGRLGYLLIWFNDDTLKLYRDDSGTLNLLANVAGIVGQTEYLRLVRLGTDYSAYYGTPASWTLFTTDSSGSIGAPVLYPGAEAQLATSPSVGFTISDFSALEWWGCVVTPDRGISYATADSAGHQFKVKLSAAGGIASSLPVLAIRTVIQCEASSDVGIDYLFYKADDTTLIAEIPTDPVHCVGGYANVTAYSVFDGPHATAADYNNGVVKFNAQVSTKISYLRVTLIYGPTTECTSADSLAFIGCILSGALTTSIRVARTILNFLIFIGQLIFFFGTLVIEFFVGLVQAFTWLLGIDPASPMFAAPVLVKGVVGIMVFGALAYIAIEGARIVAEVIGAFIP